MERQIKHMVRPIDDFLDVSGIDRGQVELRRQGIALDSLATNAIESVTTELVVRPATRVLHVDGVPERGRLPVTAGREPYALATHYSLCVFQSDTISRCSGMFSRKLWRQPSSTIL